MARLELSRQLSLSPDQAWAHASNLSELGDWLEIHEGWRGEVPTELTAGATIVGVARARRMRNRVTWTVQKVDPPRLLEMTGKGVGGTRYALEMAVTPTSAGSAFTVNIELGGRPLFGRSGRPPPVP
jgi:uncharacterized protein YndB with AHSA1/START domain